MAPKTILVRSIFLAFLVIGGLWKNCRGRAPAQGRRLAQDQQLARPGLLSGLRGTWAHQRPAHQRPARLNGETASCRRLLDNLDDQFDERRRIRQAATPAYKYRGSKTHFDLHEPEATCVPEERFGSKSNQRYEAFGDGPKFVCGVDVLAEKARREKCLVYSVGSNNDIRFEKAVHNYMKGCDVHTFDPSMGDTPFVGGEYATFHPVWKSTSASGAPDDSSLSHFLAMTRPTWLGRVARNRHRHAIEQASRRWRGGRRDDSARTCRKFLISAQVPSVGPRLRRGGGRRDDARA